ncbi:MAG: hypothetical protein NTV21_14940 [Planctomycetota bacterium]|nr:hypothetical protein [Planctomycetota bacterium]
MKLPPASTATAKRPGASAGTSHCPALDPPHTTIWPSLRSATACSSPADIAV